MEFEYDDPLEMRGVCTPKNDRTYHAISIIEEFSILGMSKGEIIELFRNPFYLGAYRLYMELGEERVLKLMDEHLKVKDS